MKVITLCVICSLCLISACSSDVNGWQEELLLQVDELRQKQITLEKDMIALKTQLAEAEKPEAVPKPAEKKIREMVFNPPVVLGDKNAKIAILEVSDFECPFCARHAREVFLT